MAGRPLEVGAQWFRRKWTATATIQVTRQDPTKRAVFYRLADTGELGSVTCYSNRPMPRPGDLLSVSYLYSDVSSKALIQPIYQRIRTDVSGPDHSDSLQYKAAARSASAGGLEVLRAFTW